MRMSSSRLWKFSSDVTYWELLLVIYKHKGNPEFGITDYIDQLKTRRQSLLTIRNFIRDRIADADFLIVPAFKKSRKALTLNDPLRRELEQYFFWIASRYQRPFPASASHSKNRSGWRF